MRSMRSIVLGVLSICGSLAAVVWLVSADIASAETVPAETKVQETISPKGVTVTKKKVVVDAKQETTDAKPIKKKKKRIDFGEFEGY